MIRACSIEALGALLEASRKKAETVNPLVVFVEKGHYQVSNSKGGYYDVYLGVQEQPERMFFIGCACRASLENKNCYHGFVAFHAHLEYIESLKSDKASENQDIDITKAPLLKPSSDKKSESLGGVRFN